MWVSINFSSSKSTYVAILRNMNSNISALSNRSHARQLYGLGWLRAHSQVKAYFTSVYTLCLHDSKSWMEFKETEVTGTKNGIIWLGDTLDAVILFEALTTGLSLPWLKNLQVVHINLAHQLELTLLLSFLLHCDLVEQWFDLCKCSRRRYPQPSSLAYHPWRNTSQKMSIIPVYITLIYNKFIKSYLFYKIYTIMNVISLPIQRFLWDSLC